MPVTSFLPEHAEEAVKDSSLEAAISNAKLPEEGKTSRITIRECPQVLIQYVVHLSKLNEYWRKSICWIGIFNCGLERLGELKCDEEWQTAKKEGVNLAAQEYSVLNNVSSFEINVDMLTHPVQRVDASVYATQ